MKQIIQSFKTGETILEEVPVPEVRKGHVLIKTSNSLVSLGTERMLVEFGKANLISKAKQQPDKVKMVLNKIKSDGLMPTLEAVFNKLEQPLPLGYCNVGVVEEVGEGVTEFKKGDRVASNGHHAQFVCIPKNLVAKIPDGVSNEEATFTVISSIGLQGIRLCNPTFGETIVVVGLGLIGLVTSELLMANGCRVIGFDFDEKKVELAKSKGIESYNASQSVDPVKAVMQSTNQVGADGVIITASTKSNDVISQAANMSRKRGRIVLVGVIGLDISRADFFEKELTFQVSCSYGPGRYDDEYEFHGIDYPLPYVRWTEKRNFETILSAMERGNLKVQPLISEVLALEDYQKIYGDIGSSSSIATLFKYPESVEIKRLINISEVKKPSIEGGIAVVGAGNFVQMNMLPAFKKIDATIDTIVSAGGLSAVSLAKKHGIPNVGSSFDEIVQDKGTGLVIITTRHNLHAEMVIKALEAQKSVFVEKPLALSFEELEIIEKIYKKSSGNLMVGYNRRFSPHSQKIKQQLGNSAIVNLSATMNAGFIPSDVWVHDLKVGGGRIVGEACHYIDLAVFFTGSLVKSVCMNALGENPEANTDNASLLLKMENGSNVAINYFSNGSKAYSKERFEVYHQEKTYILDNFRETKGYGTKSFGNLKTKQNKGHAEQFKQLVSSFKKGENLIPFNEIMNVAKASIAALESLKTNQWIDIK